jgi:DNA-binding NarL/FixJ family response regulator
MGLTGSAAKRPRLLLADDHRLVIEGLQRILEPEFEVAGMVEDGRSLLAAARQLNPDAILLDISMPLLNGIDAARQLSKSGSRARLVFVTMHTDRPFVVEAFRAGAAGYILKHATPRELLGAVRAVVRGEHYVTPGIGVDAGKLTKKSSGGPSSTPQGLTPRQREVLQLAAEGRANKEIAWLLDISVKTVEFHKSTLARKLGVKSSAELIRYAIRNGVIGL